MKTSKVVTRRKNNSWVYKIFKEMPHEGQLEEMRKNYDAKQKEMMSKTNGKIVETRTNGKQSKNAKRKAQRYGKEIKPIEKVVRY